MNYKKPELTILGDARTVIADIQHSSKWGVDSDGGRPQKNPPAYDLDE